MTEVPSRNARHTLIVLMRDTGRWVKKISKISACSHSFYVNAIARGGASN